MEEVEKQSVNFLCEEDVFWKARFIIKRQKRKTMTGYIKNEFEKIIDNFEDKNGKLDWRECKNSLNNH